MFGGENMQEFFALFVQIFYRLESITKRPEKKKEKEKSIKKELNL